MGSAPFFRFHRPLNTWPSRKISARPWPVVSVSGDVTIRLPHDVGVDIIAKSASGAVVINDLRYSQPNGTVQTIAGPDAKLMLVRTNSVSGKASLFHG